MLGEGIIDPENEGLSSGARLADFFGERDLEIHVRVLERFVPLKFAGFNFLFDHAQSSFDFLLFRGGDKFRLSPAQPREQSSRLCHAGKAGGRRKPTRRSVVQFSQRLSEIFLFA